MNLAVSKLGPALIAGNAVVLKPPTQGAVSGIHMVQVGGSSRLALGERWSPSNPAVLPVLLQCFHKAGLPKGLLQVATGRGAEIGDYLTTHPGVNCISFTGGDTGISIAKKASMVPLQMELGGKDACIVW